MFDPILSRRQFIKFTTALAVEGFCPISSTFAAGESPMLESRAIFDEGMVWAAKGMAEKVCERIKRAGFNVFIPCVWHGRGTVWPSKLAPWDHHNQRAARFDPLESLIRVAENFKLEIHPWFTVMLRQRDFLEQFYDSGTPRDSFDVHREAFREFISSLILEVVSTYPVQGINLDFVRAGGVCNSPQCIEDYRKKTQRDLLTDRNARGNPRADLKELIAWQEAAVRDIICRVARKARAVNKAIVISADAAPGNAIVRFEGQDSIKWADEGLIDVLYNMNYRPDPDFAAIKNLQSKMKRPEAMVVLCGNFDRIESTKKVVPRNAQKVKQLLAESRSVGIGNGLGLYLFSMLSDEQVDLLPKTVFKTPARPRWMNVTTTHSGCDPKNSIVKNGRS